MTPDIARRAIVDLLAQGKAEAGLSKARTAMQRFKSNPDFPNLAGLALIRTGKVQAAATHFRKALSLAPGFHAARRNLAQALVQLGQPDDALEQVNRALKAEPQAVDGLQLRAQALAAQGDMELALDAAAQAIAAAPSAPSGYALRARLFYQLGREAEALAEYETARERFVQEDCARLPDLPAGSMAYVDKMPENFRLLGFLLTAYPGARAINLYRDPRDTALSLWQEHFSGTALNYAYDMVGMAHRFNEYARLMMHWRALFPGRVLDMPYAELAADPAQVSRRVAAFCGLDWAAEMADPVRDAGPVLTASATQLRQGVHTRSVGRWRQHAEMLTPFVQALDPGLWPEIGGWVTSA